MDTQFILSIVAALAISSVLVGIGVTVFNRLAKASGSTEKGYSWWNVTLGFLILFLVLLYDFQCKGRYDHRSK